MRSLLFFTAACAGALSTAPPLSARKVPWTWRGHPIDVRALGEGPPVVLVHGFGASTTYYRRTSEALAAAGYTAWSFDLLGQGRSAKPADEYYSISLWRRQLAAFLAEFCDGGAVVCGNSLGGLVALAAAAGPEAYGRANDGEPDDGATDDDDGATDDAAAPGRVRAICLFNCAVGLNLRGVAADPTLPEPARRALGALSALVAAIFRSPLLGLALRFFVSRASLADALRGLYLHAPDNVDDELVASFYEPAQDAGALGALRQIYTNAPGPTPMRLHGECARLGAEVPIHCVWGTQDAVTPLGGGVGRFYQGLAADAAAPGVTLDRVDAGHIPMDDNPEASNRALLAWLAQLEGPS